MAHGDQRKHGWVGPIGMREADFMKLQPVRQSSTTLRGLFLLIHEIRVVQYSVSKSLYSRRLETRRPIALQHEQLDVSAFLYLARFKLCMYVSMLKHI